MIPTKYKTIKQRAISEITEKKSKFISVATPVDSEESAVKIINEIKKTNYNANHNVFAYSVGLENPIMRISDDGEPNGTAALPILEIIKGEDLKNILLVVTRYFGGTLLGTGGLVRAYSKAARQAIDNALIIENEMYGIYTVTCDYNIHGKLQYEILKGAIIEDTIFTDIVEMKVIVKSDNEKGFEKSIIEASSAKCNYSRIKSVYACFVDGGLEIAPNSCKLLTNN